MVPFSIAPFDKIATASAVRDATRTSWIDRTTAERVPGLTTNAA